MKRRKFFAAASSLAVLAAALLTLGWDTELFRVPFGIYLLYAGGSMLWGVWKQRGQKK